MVRGSWLVVGGMWLAGGFSATGHEPQIANRHLHEPRATNHESPSSRAADPAFSPGFFWMWSHELDAGKLIGQLEDMHAHAIRSVCIHPVPKDFRKGIFDGRMTPDYLTPEYFAVYKRVVERARELGMTAWLYDEGGWPSGGACGQVAKSDAEGKFRSRWLSFDDKGNASVVASPYAGNPPVPSIIERGATERFIGLTHERYLQAMPEEIGKTLRFCFTDEPNMPPWRGGGASRLAWTADFDAVFRAKKGYDLRPLVPALLADKKEEDEKLARARVDYHEVRADLTCERYLLPLRDWCRAHGMISGGHVNGEDVPEKTTVYGYGDLMRALRAMDCPGVDVIWRQLFPQTAQSPAVTRPFPRYAGSALHQNGGRYALSETFGIFGDSCTPDQMKWLVDYQLVRGINRFVFAYYGMSNEGQWTILFEPHSGPVAPYWDFEPHFFRYVERTAAFMAQGRPGAEIAVLYDTRAFWAGGEDCRHAAARHYAAAEALDRMNCDYDFVGDADLAQAAVGKDGTLVVGAMTYRALVLPSSKWLSDGARAAVARFRQAGGCVVDGEPLPLHKAALPRTLVVRGDGAAHCRVMKRVDGARAIYLVVNESIAPQNVAIDFGGKRPVARYDAERDVRTGVETKDGVASWTFPGYGSAIFVVGDDGPALPPPKRYATRLAELKDGWTLRRTVNHDARLVSKEPRRYDLVVDAVDEPAKSVALGDWRKQLGAHFAGRAVYRVAFEMDAARKVCLDLGQVCWCAGVRLNGVDCGKRFFGPFRWEVQTAKGTNVLEVEVANLLSPLLGDEDLRARLVAAHPPQQMYERHQSAADRLNHESGLFGPVVVYGE